ncbi:MAG: response regulator [Blastocatellia bacterium]
MSRQGRILIVEDEQRWRDALTNTLRKGGFQTEAVGTISEAWECLKEEFYHLAILDIRMEDNSDPTDVEGMNLLRKLSEEGLTDAMGVIMLSGHGTTDQMRESFKRHNIQDFLSKDQFDNREFLAQVKEIFAQKTLVNLDLAIHWQQINGNEEAVLNMRIGETRIKHKSPMRALIAEEINDLLSRLFHRSDSILIKQLAPGFSGTAVLLVTPSSSTSGAGQPFIVKCGDVKEINSEYQRFKDYVQNFIGGGRITSIMERRRTAHLGGIVYSLLGTASNRLESFGNFYKRAELPKIKDAIDDLFLVTCGQWYANPGKVELHDLTAEYLQNLELSPDGLEQDRINLKSAQGKEQLRISGLPEDRLFTDPVSVMVKNYFVEPTYICPTHGDLNESNVLIDETGHTWLIDFGRTGLGHILRDVAELDTSIRFQLLGENDATLDERLKLEDALCRAKQFSDLQGIADNFETENTALAKVYATVIHLRKLAKKLVERNLNASIKEYNIALFYYALGHLRYYSLPRMQREHALISASLVAESFSEGK